MNTVNESPYEEYHIDSMNAAAFIKLIFSDLFTAFIRRRRLSKAGVYLECNIHFLYEQ